MSETRVRPGDVERALLVRAPYADQLVRGLKRYEMRRTRHRLVGEVVGIIRSGGTGGKRLPMFVGAVELGRVRRVPEADFDVIAPEACTTGDKLREYARGRDHLWAWEIWQAFPATRPVEIPLKGGHQTWVRIADVPAEYEKTINPEW